MGTTTTTVPGPTTNANPTTTTTTTTRNTTSSCQPGEQNWECCTAESPCNSPLTGDCDENGCAGDLVCGEQNCGAADPTGYMDCCDFKRCSSDEDCSTTGMFCTANGCGEGSSESCCRTQPDKRMIWGEPEPEPTRTRTPSTGRCSPRNTGRLAWTCCSTYTPCGHGEGDCDSNSDCKLGHFCGNGNCKDLVSNLPRESLTMDCCKRNPLQDIVQRPFDPIRPPLRPEPETTTTIREYEGLVERFTTSIREYEPSGQTPEEPTTSRPVMGGTTITPYVPSSGTSLGTTIAPFLPTEILWQDKQDGWESRVAHFFEIEVRPFSERLSLKIWAGPRLMVDWATTDTGGLKGGRVGFYSHSQDLSYWTS